MGPADVRRRRRRESRAGGRVRLPIRHGDRNRRDRFSVADFDRLPHRRADRFRRHERRGSNRRHVDGDGVRLRSSIAGGAHRPGDRTARRHLRAGGIERTAPADDACAAVVAAESDPCERQGRHRRDAVFRNEGGVARGCRGRADEQRVGRHRPRRRRARPGRHRLHRRRLRHERRPLVSGVQVSRVHAPEDGRRLRDRRPAAGPGTTSPPSTACRVPRVSANGRTRRSWNRLRRGPHG